MKSYIDKTLKGILCLYACVLPWIIFGKELYYNQEEKRIVPSSIAGVKDYFLYGKAWLTIVVAIIIAVILIVEVVVYKEKLFDIKSLKSKIIIVCFLIYNFCTIVSYIVATNKQTALTGGVNSCEGILVLISYSILFIAAHYIWQVRQNTELKGKLGKSKVNILECIVMFHGVVLTVLAAIEIFYKPIVDIIVGHSTENVYNNMLSLTFSSPSYCAGYIVLLLPFCIYFMANAVDVIKSIVWSVLCVTVTIAGLLTRSTAGFYLIITEIIVMTIVLFIRCFYLKKNIKDNDVSKKDMEYLSKNIYKVLSFVVVLLIVVVVNIFSNGKILSATTSSAMNKTTPIHSDNYYKVKDITLAKTRVTIKGNDNSISCVIDENGSIYFTDEANNVIDINTQAGVISFPKPYDMISAGFENNALWLDFGYKGKVRFLVKDKEFYPMTSDGSIVNNISAYNNVTENDKDYNYDSWDSIFTGRGYIWRKSLPILKNTIIFGHGAGTFGLYFKQFDYVGLLNSQGEVDLIIDKPHSLYLQIACNQGVLSVVALIVMIFIIVFTVIVNLKKSKSYNSLPMIIVVISFCIFEIITDSSVTVNPLFWILIGGLSKHGNK